MSTYGNENLAAIKRQGPGNYQLFELSVGDRWEIHESGNWESQSDALDAIEAHWGNDWKHVSPETIVSELAARKSEVSL